LAASEERLASLETTLDYLLEKVPPATLERLSEDLLRRIFIVQYRAFRGITCLRTLSTPGFLLPAMRPRVLR